MPGPLPAAPLALQPSPPIVHPPSLQVRSCSLDTWLPEQVEFMARTGNALANAYWEGGMKEGQKPRALSSLAGEHVLWFKPALDAKELVWISAEAVWVCDLEAGKLIWKLAELNG